MKKIDVIGKKFGKLTVIEDIFHRDTNGRARRILKCHCDCGTVCYPSKEKVLRGHTISCGCEQEKMRKSLGSKNKKDYGEAAFNETYSSYRKSAKKRGYSFELTKDEFREIIVKPCIYCGESLTQEKIKKSSNGTFKYTGIDRYDNTKGYVFDNCVPCCKVCNRIKSDLSVEIFENKLEKIYSRKNMWKRTA